MSMTFLMVTPMIKVIGIDPDMRKCGMVHCVGGQYYIDLKPKYTTAMIIEDISVWIDNGYTFAVEDVNTTRS